MREIFSLFDKDCDGYVDVRELGKVLRSMGMNPTEVEIEDLINQYRDVDGKINSYIYVENLFLVSFFKDALGDRALHNYDYSNNYMLTKNISAVY